MRTSEGNTSDRATWVTITLGWSVLVLLYVGGRASNAVGTPPFPTLNATVALMAFWFANSLFLHAFAGLVGLVPPSFSQRGVFRSKWLPVAALAVGLVIARLFWSVTK